MLRFVHICVWIIILKEVDGTITLFLLSVIVLHLSLMSSERFIAIKFALRYQAIVTKRRARIVSIAMWLWALVIVIALPWTLYGITGHKEFREFCREMHPDSDKAQELHIRWHLVFTAASMFLVPLLIMICSYTYIFIVSYKQRQRVRKQGRDVPGMHIWMEKWGIQKRFSQDAKVLLSEFSTWTPIGIVGHIQDLIYFSLRQIG